MLIGFAAQKTRDLGRRDTITRPLSSKSYAFEFALAQPDSHGLGVETESFGDFSHRQHRFVIHAYNRPQHSAFSVLFCIY